MAIKPRNLSAIKKAEDAKCLLTKYSGRDVLHAGRYYYTGTNPSDVPTDDLLKMLQTVDWSDDVEARYRRRIRNRSTGIRAYCVTCKGGSPKSVRNCLVVDCPLWPFRLGSNPFRKRR